MNKTYIPFSSLYAVPSRNGVYATKDNHGYGTSIINMGELFGNDFIQHGNGEKVNLNDREKELSMLEDGDLLFARRSLVESGAGKCSIVLQPSEDLTFESSVIRVRLNKNKCNPLFYYYWLKSNTGKSAMRTLVTGSNVKGIKGSELGNLLVPNISLPLQNAITDILLTFDLKIANNNKLCFDFESMVKTLFDYWFIQFDFPNENGKPYKSSGGKMVWNEEVKREIPKGWEVKTFGDILYFEKGKIPDNLEDKQKGDCVSPYITIDVANNGNPQFCNPNGMISCKGETIMVMDGAASGDIYIGNTGSLGSTFCKMPSKRHDISNTTIYLLLCHNMPIYKRANTGSTVPHANRSFIEQMKIVLPTDVSSFSNQFDLINERIISARNENRQLAELRDFLLPMLMNGQVKVKGA